MDRAWVHGSLVRRTVESVRSLSRAEQSTR